jgi:GNAT superfamily N-acetyltransferase
MTDANPAGLTIARMTALSNDDLRELVDVLMDAVDSGAGVSFMSDLTRDTAEAWWRKVFASATARTVILVARDATSIVGTVQVHPSWAPNQPHRGDVAKLMVHRRGRGQGVARALMAEVERYARAEKMTLLLLDTCEGGAAERLYTSLDWRRVGVVPNFALNPDGSWCNTVFFYKEV